MLRRPFVLIFKPGEGKSWHVIDAKSIRAGGDPGESGEPPKKLLLHGDIFRDFSYPGCPYCKGKTVVLHSQCSAYICSGAAEVAGDNATYCTVCKVDVEIGTSGGLKDAASFAAPADLDALGAPALRLTHQPGSTASRSIGVAPRPRP